MSNIESLVKCLEPEKVRLNEPMSAHTTLKVGGEADIFYVTESSGDLVKAVRLARSFGVPLTVIGEGSGVVVSDSGLRGVVVKSCSERIFIKPIRSIKDFFRKSEPKKAEVTIDGGVKMVVAIKKLCEKGVFGLEKLEGYAGSVAGAVKEGVGSEFLKKISVIDSHGGVKSMAPKKKIGDDIVTDATFVLSLENTQKIKGKMKKHSLAVKKEGVGEIGKVFKNLAKADAEILGYPTDDPAYLIGEVLNLKGLRVGEMKISTKNSNTLINLGKAKADDYVKMVEEIKRRAREAVGIELEENVVRLGVF